MSGVAGESGVRVWAEYDRDFQEEADAVVVGSGPAGAVAAHELARSGLRVVLVEEGPPFTPGDFALDGALSMARTMREGGLRATRGTVMPTMQAICLGGGSLVNSAICVRAPDFVLDRWCEEFQLRETTRAALEPHYDAVGAFLGIAPTPEDVLGRRNLLFRRGCDELGYSAEPIQRTAARDDAQPRANRAARGIETRGVCPQLGKHFLGDVLRVAGVPHDAQREGIDEGGVAVVQRLQPSRIAGRDPGDRLDVVPHARNTAYRANPICPPLRNTPEPGPTAQSPRAACNTEET